MVQQTWGKTEVVVARSITDMWIKAPLNPKRTAHADFGTGGTITTIL